MLLLLLLPFEAVINSGALLVGFGATTAATTTTTMTTTTTATTTTTTSAAVTAAAERALRALFKSFLMKAWHEQGKMVKSWLFRLQCSYYNFHLCYWCNFTPQQNGRVRKYLNFCGTCLPLASTRWVWSTFSSHCPLSSYQRRWFTSAMAIFFLLKTFWERWKFNLGQLGPESSVLTIELC